jgi:hypothetical protein
MLSNSQVHREATEFEKKRELKQHRVELFLIKKIRLEFAFHGSSNVAFHFLFM